MPQPPEYQRAQLPCRGYLVLRGDLGPAGAAWWEWAEAHGQWEQTPNLFWPADRAWCAATEIDRPVGVGPDHRRRRQRLIRKRPRKEKAMGNVIAAAAMSLDGFVADTGDQVGPLFDWYGNGSVEFTGNDPDRVFRTSAASAEYARPLFANIGAAVIGRHLFDITDGWGGVPAAGDAVFVVTHAAPDGLGPPRRAVHVRHRRAAQRGRAGQAFAGNLTGQAVAEGLVDEISVSLVPVVFGSGVRFFGDFAPANASEAALVLDDPQVVQGDRVTHLHFACAGADPPRPGWYGSGCQRGRGRVRIR